MKGIEVAFAGRLINAEMRTASGGREWMSMTMIVGEGDAEQWVNVASWSQTLAELAPALVRGVELYIEGKLKLRTWKDSDGSPRSGLSVSASLVQPMALIGQKKPKKPRAEKAKPAQPQTTRSQALPFNDDISYIGT